MSKGAASRAAAAYSLQQVLQHQRSLNQALPEAASKFKLSAEDKSFTQAIAFGVLRELPSLEWYLSQLLDKPLKSKVRIIHYLLLVGIYQLCAMRTAQHAAVSATVDASPLVKQKALKNLVNAILRRFIREQDALQHNLRQVENKQLNHPAWLVKRLQRAYPESWQDIILSNQQQPPMWLRVNARYLAKHQMSQHDYQARLHDQGVASQAIAGLPMALRLDKPCDVTLLPGFAEGAVSVQDAAAQYAPQLIPAKPGQRILDACAAPGGKTAHLLEQFDVKMDALDIDSNRLERVSENLQRLQLDARVLTGDAASKAWWDGELYDHILLDAPCSATGVIRRHPDIKWLRQDSDIPALVELQRSILENLWQLLKPGGTLLYATCSVLPEENSEQIESFIKHHPEAQLTQLTLQHFQAEGDELSLHSFAKVDTDRAGLQWLPQVQGHDGFFYAALVKT